MKAILHIGTEKTGTTSFQNFCHHNCDELLKQKVLYPSRLGGVNHRQIATSALNLDSKDDALELSNFDTLEDLKQFREDVREKLRSQVADAPNAEVCVLSTEHLHSRLDQTEQIERVREMLDPLFEEIEVHIHLRPQIDVVVSLASTQTRVGGAVRRTFFERANPQKLYYNYNRLTEKWEDVFGASRVHLLAFRKTSGFLGFMESHLGLDFSEMEAPTRVNEAIDVRVMAMVNALVDSGTSQRIDHRVIDKFPVEQKVRPDLQTALAVQKRFSASNQKLVARRHDLVEGDLVPNWGAYPEVGNLELLEQPCTFSNALADLISHYNDEIKAARK